GMSLRLRCRIIRRRSPDIIRLHVFLVPRAACHEPRWRVNTICLRGPCIRSSWQVLCIEPPGAGGEPVIDHPLDSTAALPTSDTAGGGAPGRARARPGPPVATGPMDATAAVPHPDYDHAGRPAPREIHERILARPALRPNAESAPRVSPARPIY